MQYRISFRKAKKENKLVKVFKNVGNNIKNSFSRISNNTRNKFDAFCIKFNQIPFGEIFKRLGIFILFLIPVLLVLGLDIYLLGWFGSYIWMLFNNPMPWLLKVTYSGFDAVTLHVVFLWFGFECTKGIIEAITTKLNGDLNSIKSYLRYLAEVILISTVLVVILLHPTWFKALSCLTGWVTKIGLVLGVLGLLGKILPNKTEPEWDFTEIAPDIIIGRKK